jgi:protein-disulfide isomerase
MKRGSVLKIVLTLIVLPSSVAQVLSGQQREAETAGSASGRDDRVTEELKQIRVQLTRIEKRLAAAIPEEETVKVNISGSYAIGQRDAPVTLVEFADYQCPFCRHFHTTTFHKLRKNYIDTGKLRFVVLNLPLNIHPAASKAAEAALCAGEQSKYWEMQDLLVANSSNLGSETPLGYADQLGLDKVLFRSCLESDKYAAKVKADVAQAEDLDIQSTPTFVLGRTQDKEIEGVKLLGTQRYARLETLIQGLLNSQP